MTHYNHPHLTITVNDIEETKQFYSSIGFSIELDIYSEEKRRNFLLLSGFGLEIEIFKFKEQESNQNAKLDLKNVGLQHFALPVENIENKKQELLDNGIDIVKDISISSLGVKNINVQDPSGFIIEFFEKK